MHPRQGKDTPTPSCLLLSIVNRRSPSNSSSSINRSAESTSTSRKWDVSSLDAGIDSSKWSSSALRGSLGSSRERSRGGNKSINSLVEINQKLQASKNQISTIRQTMFYGKVIQCTFKSLTYPPLDRLQVSNASHTQWRYGIRARQQQEEINSIVKLKLKVAPHPKQEIRTYNYTHVHHGVQLHAMNYILEGATCSCECG